MSKGTGQRPNIILIMVDDMGFSDIGCYGSEINTPNLDHMSASGASFSQFYNYARCCPTRAALLTGVYPHQAGIGHMTVDLGWEGYRGFINDNTITIGEALKISGYNTAMAGKWHVGGDYLLSTPESARPGEPGWPMPVQRGFDHHYGTLIGAGSFFNPHTLVSDYDHIEPEGDDYYYTDAIGDHSVKFIDDMGAKEEPFFLYTAFTAPHWPLHAFEEDIAKYKGRYRNGWDELRKSRYEEAKGSGVIDAKWAISQRDENQLDWNTVEDQDWEDARMAVYAAQIDRMDQNIGKILTKLRAMDIENNTLIMFLSDNGGCAEFLKEDGRFEFAPSKTRDGQDVKTGNTKDVMPGPADTYMSYDLSWANASNSPFRLFKHWTHEGGISTPFIAYWPDVIDKEHRVFRGAGHIIDVMATCLDAAGGQYPEDRDGFKLRPMQGQSLLPAFENESWTRDGELFWEHEGNIAVRQNEWKLVRKFPGDFELYNMDEDRTETNNLARKMPERILEMTGLYDSWASRSYVIPWERVLDHPDMTATRKRLKEQAPPSS
tara:strand:- start:913 stop:2553 length:1641 start_codon:yes stop_codon:yes gene_type:complete